MSKTLQRSLEAKLAALDGPEWESSDEEERNENANIVNKKTKKDEKKKKRMGSEEKSPKSNIDEDASSIIYVGHIPSEFQEPELLAFFAQFGTVQNLKLSRSKRTGNSRGYAFIQFTDVEVASIVAQTMSGYFISGTKRLVSHIVPKDKVHPDLFKGLTSKNRKRFQEQALGKKSVLQIRQDKMRKEVNKPKTTEGMKKITERLIKREMKKRSKLASLGIEYDFPGYAASATVAASSKTDEPITSLVDSEKNDESRKEKKRKVSHNGGAEHPAEANVDDLQEPKKQNGSKAPSKSNDKKKKRKDSEASLDSTSSLKKKKAKTPRKNSDATLESIPSIKKEKVKTPRKNSEASLESTSSTKKEKVKTPRKNSEASLESASSSKKEKVKTPRKNSEASLESTSSSKQDKVKTPRKNSEASLESISSSSSKKKKDKTPRKKSVVEADYKVGFENNIALVTEISTPVRSNKEKKAPVAQTEVKKSKKKKKDSKRRKSSS